MYQNVEYELYELEKLITCPPGEMHEPDGVFWSVASKADGIHAESQRIGAGVLQHVFADDASLARYIQFHQRALIALMDRVFPSGNPALFQQCYSDLSDVLAFLRKTSESTSTRASKHLIMSYRFYRWKLRAVRATAISVR